MIKDPIVPLAATAGPECSRDLELSMALPPLYYYVQSASEGFKITKPSFLILWERRFFLLFAGALAIRAGANERR